MSDSSFDEMERRKSFRLDMEKELVDITWTDESGQLRSKKIACLDFGRGGLKLVQLQFWGIPLPHQECQKRAV